MADFLNAIDQTLKHEGRFVDNPNDPGGATDFGISLRFLASTTDLDHDGFLDGDINRDGKIDYIDIKTLTEKEAIKLYRLYFWDPGKYELIHSQIIASKLFDLAVNTGNHVAGKIAQRAIRSALGLFLVEDGVLGQRTISAINMAKSEILLAAIKSEAAGFYRSLPKKLTDSFLKGWLNRAYADPK